MVNLVETVNLEVTEVIYMKAVPHIDFPLLEDLEKYRDTIPGYDEMISIILAESEKGNVVVHIGDAGEMPRETMVIVDFAYEPRCDYEKIKVFRRNAGFEYKYLITGDRKGSTEIDFGAWKYRMKEELAVQIQRRLETFVFEQITS